MTSMMAEPATGVADRGHVRVLTQADLGPAARLLARGFEDDPSSVAFIPDVGRRLRVNEISSRRALRAALPYASVHGIDLDGELGGAAIWHPPGVTAQSLGATLEYAGGVAREVPMLWSVAAEVVPGLLRDRRAVIRLMKQRSEAVREASAGPTWHLAFLATDAAHRGKGLARRLLDHVLTRCDADGLAAWLETTSPANPPIYERFGFETTARIEGGATMPTWWVMRRPPQPGAMTDITSD